MFTASGARTALDLFTGTTRVAQEFKRRGGLVTTRRHRPVLRGVRALLHRDRRATRWTSTRWPRRSTGSTRSTAGPGTSPRRSARRRATCSPRTARGSTRSATRSTPSTAIRRSFPMLLTSLIEAADRVDSTVGVQMAYLKQWAPRAHNPLTLRVPGAPRRHRHRDPRGRGRAGRITRLVRPRVPRPAVQPAPVLHELPRVGDAGRVGPSPSTTASRASASTPATTRRRARSTGSGRCRSRCARASRTSTPAW